MSVAIIDSTTVTTFVNDSEAFKKYVDEKFDVFDMDKNGVISRDELQKRHGAKMASREFELQSGDEIECMYDALFRKFDVEQSGSIGREGFLDLMREIMLAKARGIGDSPVSIILQGDSLLMRAVERENNGE